MRLIALLLLGACSRAPEPRPPCFIEGSLFIACSVARDANTFAVQRSQELGCPYDPPELYSEAFYSRDQWDPEIVYAEYLRLLTADTCEALALEPQLGTNP